MFRANISWIVRNLGSRPPFLVRCSALNIQGRSNWCAINPTAAMFSAEHRERRDQLACVVEQAHASVARKMGRANRRDFRKPDADVQRRTSGCVGCAQGPSG